MVLASLTTASYEGAYGASYGIQYVRPYHEARGRQKETNELVG